MPIDIATIIVSSTLSPIIGQLVGKILGYTPESANNKAQQNLQQFLSTLSGTFQENVEKIVNLSNLNQDIRGLKADIKTTIDNYVAYLNNGQQDRHLQEAERHARIAHSKLAVLLEEIIAYPIGIDTHQSEKANRHIAYEAADVSGHLACVRIKKNSFFDPADANFLASKTNNPEPFPVVTCLKDTKYSLKVYEKNIFTKNTVNKVVLPLKTAGVNLIRSAIAIEILIFGSLGSQHDIHQKTGECVNYLQQIISQFTNLANKEKAVVHNEQTIKTRYMRDGADDIPKYTKYEKHSKRDYTFWLHTNEFRKIFPQVIITDRAHDPALIGESIRNEFFEQIKYLDSKGNAFKDADSLYELMNALKDLIKQTTPSIEATITADGKVYTAQGAKRIPLHYAPLLINHKILSLIEAHPQKHGRFINEGQNTQENEEQIPNKSYDTPTSYTSSLAAQIPFAQMVFHYLSKWVPWNKQRIATDDEKKELQLVQIDLSRIEKNIAKLKLTIVGTSNLFIEDLKWLQQRKEQLRHDIRVILKGKKTNNGDLQEIRDLYSRMNEKIKLLLSHQETLSQWVEESSLLVDKNQRFAVTYDFINHRLSKRLEKINESDDIYGSCYIGETLPSFGNTYYKNQFVFSTMQEYVCLANQSAEVELKANEKMLKP